MDTTRRRFIKQAGFDKSSLFGQSKNGVFSLRKGYLRYSDNDEEFERYITDKYNVRYKFYVYNLVADKK